MTAAKPKFTEADLCAAFIASIPEEWQAYAETAGFDILLVRKADGFQIGVEAKLKLNGKVLAQAVEANGWFNQQGPDCRAVLVPRDINTELAPIAAYVGLTVLRVDMHDDWPGLRRHFWPTLPSDTQHGFWGQDDWHQLLPSRHCDVPEYVPDVVAGAPAPVQLTRWKVGALKLAILLQHRGHLTRADFKHHGIDIRRWIAAGAEWLVPAPQGFIAGRRLPDFRAQHPQVWEQIEAEPEKWLPQGDQA